jgi:hypothetical protein
VRLESDFRDGNQIAASDFLAIVLLALRVRENLVLQNGKMPINKALASRIRLAEFV